MAVTIQHVCQTLGELAPLSLAEPWDNVGLLVGDRRASVERVMVCLTVIPAVVAEAIERRAELIVSHHPLPFKPLARITRDTVAGSMLLDLIGGGVAVYSAHTAWDSAVDGINQQLADALRLSDVAALQSPVEPIPGGQGVAKGAVDSGRPAAIEGAGRYGRIREGTTLGQVAERVAAKTSAEGVRLVGAGEQLVRKVALACGSGGGFLDAAVRRGCNAMVTGEATFHTCLDAESRGVGLILLGHYASERFAMEELAGRLAALHGELAVWASDRDRDPIHSI